jgi:hypothetical protein
VKIPFKRKSSRSSKEEGVDTSKAYFRPNEIVGSNISNPVKNPHPIKSDANYQICFECNNIISGEIKKPEWRWNLNTSQPMCIVCFERKSEEYEKINNYCNGCRKKLGFIRYNPKPLWDIKGQLCRTCWDLENSNFKEKNLKE